MNKSEIKTIKDTIEILRREVPKCRDYAPFCFSCELNNVIALLEYHLSLNERVPEIKY